MKLTLSGIKEKEAWLSQDIKLPCYDIEEVTKNTWEEPEWIHFGAGNIFRGFIGSINQTLLNKGLTKTGIIAAETFDFDIIDKIYAPHDNLTLSVLMRADSSLEKEVIASITGAVKSTETEKLFDIAKKPSLKMMSFTITEKGYALYAPDSTMLGIVSKDIENGPSNPVHAMSVVCAMLLERYKNGAYPLAVVSMDNCSHNGEKLMSSVLTIARGWVDNNFTDDSFIEYLNTKVSFPWSMIDKITPRPSDTVKAELYKSGVEDMEPVITSKGTYIAPFVNAESAQYLVIEDDFPNGRPALEEAGVYLTSRETVNKAETMKVTTCLNPLHTALAVFGCVLGYTTIWEEMRDKELCNLVNKIADEGMKVVINPEIIDPQAFVNEVINERLTNPNIPDAPQRIATDTSQKVGIRYGETIKSYTNSDKLDINDLTAIPMAIAGWLRYLLAVDDEGNSFERSQDPLLNSLDERLAGIEFGNPESVGDKLNSILCDKSLFGSDLCEAGLSAKIENYFKKMIKGNGAARKTLAEI